MNLVKFTDAECVNVKAITYIRCHNDDNKYQVTIKFRGRYQGLTWTFNSLKDSKEFYNKITNILLNNESDSCNGGK